MTPWQGYQFHRLTRLPREGDPDGRDGEDRDRTGRSLLASLTGAHADLLASGDSDPEVVAAWVRPPGDQRLHLLVGGRPGFPPAAAVPPAAGGAEPDPAGAARPVLFPPGAAATDLPAAGVAELLAVLPYWVACAGQPDALWAAEQRTPVAPHRGSFDRHAAHLGGPYGWLVLAQPMQAKEVQPELDALVNEILPLTRGEVGEAKRVGLERKQARHRELSRWQEGGCWRVRVLVGGRHPDSAMTAAAMLCAATELDGLPYLLAPAGRPVPLPAALDSRGGDGNAGGAGGGGPAAFTASTELLVALTRPPRRELPGVRLVQRSTFDVTADLDPDRTSGGLPLGTVLDEAGAGAGTLALPPGSLNRHTFVCGATGAGKSMTVRHLLALATRAGLPWLVVEPAKAEYARMAARLAPLGGEVVVVRPNHPDRPPAGLNPLEPAPGFPLQTHVDLLKALFLAAFEPIEPLPQVLAAALTRCYEELGWDVGLGEPIHPGHHPRYPTLTDLQQVAEEVVNEIGYGKEVADNVRGFIRVRIASLRLGSAGRFFEGGHPIDFGRLHERNVVLEVEDVGDDADKAFLMGAVLMRLVEHLRMATRSGGTRAGLAHLTVIEEAHRLLRRPDRAVGAAAHAVEMFASLLAEVRAYGEGLVIAEQIPSKLVPDVIKNTAVKIVHRLPALDDRESVGATMNLDADQSRYVVTLTPGEGAVFADGMDRPVLIQVPDGTAAESGPVSTAAVTDLIGRRSPTCGVDCQAEACTLRQMRAAQHLLAAELWLVAWAELTVLAHLTGDPVPIPRPALLAALARQRPLLRTLDCAVSHAVDDAVAVRTTSLQPSMDAATLASHVSTAIRRMLTGHDSGCGGDALRYLGRPYRWELVRQHLERDATVDGRHPRTAEWETTFRSRIPGQTRTAQLQAVKARMKADWDDTPRREAATYGTRRPSTLESLVGTAGEGRQRRVEAVLDQFTNGGWALVHLVPNRHGS